MSRPIVLRFRDVEANTVEEHRRLIDRFGQTWWGWWKKDAEPLPSADLAAIAAEVPIVVGLVNRQSEAYYAATCGQVALAQPGQTVSSPTPEQTPTYYADGRFPAWFALTSIVPMLRSEWEAQFGPTPEGEPTLFFSSSNHESAQEWVIDGDDVSITAIPSSVILHLSDLHFGPDHGFPLTSTAVPRRLTLAQQIGEGLRSIGVENVGLAVVSGDLTTRADLAGLYQAQQFLAELIAEIEISESQLVIVPGNHDISLDETQATRNYSAELPFRNLLQAVHGKPVLELNRLNRFAPPSGPEILVLALNSVRPRSAATKEYGYVGQDFYAPLLREATEISRRSREARGIEPIKIAVLHHHVLPTALVEEPDDERPISLTLDAGQLIEDLQQAHFDIVLHGHQHVPFVGSTSRMISRSGSWSVSPAIHVLGAGSTGVRVDRLWNVMRNNSVALIEPGDREVGLRILQFAPGVAFTPFATVSLELHGRRSREG